MSRDELEKYAIVLLQERLRVVTETAEIMIKGQKREEEAEAKYREVTRELHEEE